MTSLTRSKQKYLDTYLLTRVKFVSRLRNDERYLDYGMMREDSAKAPGQTSQTLCSCLPKRSQDASIIIMKKVVA